ncbi:hypothetical protein JW960_11565 [candidate division KSB1 bacterium]|nr:hypothetical protein [candidate division KSB1 bacterium]
MHILILLIGGNPLPNFVITKYLFEERNIDDNIKIKPDLILLIHTTETERFARKLKKAAEQHTEKVEFLTLEDSGREPLYIRNKIIEKLEKIKRDTLNVRSLHLNYIGGTKTMAVQITRTVENWVTENPGTKFILSDVNPKNHKIVISQNGVGYPLTGDLRDLLKLTTHQLFQLHDMKIYNEGLDTLSVDKDDLLSFCSNLLEIYKGSERKNFGKKVTRIGIMYNQIKRDNDKETEEEILKTDNILRLKNQIEQKIPTLNNLFSKAETPNTQKIKFVTGGWLEELVQNSLFKLQTQVWPEIHEIRRSIKAEYEGRTTEIDVIAIQGYQLYLFSCTTANRISIVKQKAFEALYRAEQLGGEHAKVILVSTLFNNYNSNEEMDSEQNIHNLQELKKDLSQFDAARNCIRIGIDELEGEIMGKNTLTEKFKSIF